MSEYCLARNNTADILETFTKHKLGREMLWNWFKTGYSTFEQKLSGGLGKFARMVKTCTGSLTTREQYEDVKRFFEGKNTEVSELANL
jgi:aminopeptidase 2